MEEEPIYRMPGKKCGDRSLNTCERDDKCIKDDYTSTCQPRIYIDDDDDDGDLPETPPQINRLSKPGPPIYRGSKPSLGGRKKSKSKRRHTKRGGRKTKRSGSKRRGSKRRGRKTKRS